MASIKHLTRRRVDPAKLVALRLGRGWSRKRLAEESGRSESYIKYIEYSQRHPSVFVAQDIADALEVGIDEFSEPWTDEQPKAKAS